MRAWLPPTQRGAVSGGPQPIHAMVMKLYFLRHGRADWPDWEEDDDKRPLDKKGIEETHEVAKFLRKLGVKPDVVVSSPLPRAHQTAKIAAKEFSASLVDDTALSPGCNVDKLKGVLKRHREKEVVIVGHEPDFSAMLKDLTGADLKIPKAGIARVDMEEDSHGKLIWLLPPKIAAA